MPKGSGRRPLPTAVKKLRGNPGHRKIAADEPKPVLGRPEMPPGLPQAAQSEWKRIVPELEQLGVLATVDRAALAAYCHAYARWFEAELEIKRLGIVVEEPILLMGVETGFCRYKKNPAVTISEGAMKLMKSFLVEFGMTPAARTRVRIEKPKEADPLEDFLAAKGQPGQGKHVN